MALLVNKRNFIVPSFRKLRWNLLALQQSQFVGVGQHVNEREIIVRNHFLTRIGSRKKTLTVGLLVAGKKNRNVLLYRKPQPNPTQFYPVFTPQRRQVKALGLKVAPFPAIGPGGSGMNLQHFLGLSLMQLGGVRF